MQNPDFIGLFGDIQAWGARLLGASFLLKQREVVCVVV